MRVRSTLIAVLASAAMTVGALTATLPAEATAPAYAEGGGRFANPEYRTGVSIPTGTTVDARGNTVLADRWGRAVQLRGTNLGKFDDISRRDVEAMAAAGFTLLRLPIQWSKVEPRQGRYDESYVEHIEDVLDWAEDAGVLVLVDWHQDVFGPAFGFNGVPRWATRTDGIDFEPLPGDDWFANYFQPAVQAAFRHLFSDADLQRAQARTWRYLARRLAGHDALLGYDLFNEPMGQIDADDLSDPETLARKSAAFESGDLAAMYRRLIRAVRSVDTRSWLWVEPTVLVGEGIPTALPDFADPRRGRDRIGYAPHAYSTAVEAGGDWDPDSGFVQRYEAAITEYPRTAKMPVIVGEWGPIAAGDSYPGNTTLVERQARSFERFASGWAIWYGCRSDSGGGYCIFTEDGHLDPGRAGAWTPYSQRLAGERQEETVTDGTYTLRFTPTRGLHRSRIIVPAGFADRLSVSARTEAGRHVAALPVVSQSSRTGARTITLWLASSGRSSVVLTVRPR